MSRLGHGLPTEVRTNFGWLIDEWNRVCREKHGNEWPAIFMGKIQGVINALPENPSAFKYFIYDEEREIFDGTFALTVPSSVPPGLVAIEN